MVVLDAADRAPSVDVLRGRLLGATGGNPETERLDLVVNVGAAVLRRGSADAAERAPDDQAVAVRAAEADAAQVLRGQATWLPRLGFELTRARSELTEQASQSLVQLEQRCDQSIQNDVAGATRDLPRRLLDELRSVQQASDVQLMSRLDAVADQFMAGRLHEFLPGGIERAIAPPDAEVRLLDVSQAHVDRRTELFAGLGNFGSGRQSLSLVGTVATAASVPVALVGGVIGLGFWRVGRQSRQDGQARVHASRWLKVQVAEAGRVVRYRIDHELNQAQLVLNLAVRDYYERAGADARQAADAARQHVAELETSERERAERVASRASRAQQLLTRSRTVRVGLAAAGRDENPS
jgi:hypothetical protein